MATYQISSQGGTVSIHAAETPDSALDAMARAAGYDDHMDACDVTGEEADDWTTDEHDFRKGRIAFLVEEIASNHSK